MNFDSPVFSSNFSPQTQALLSAEGIPKQMIQIDQSYDSDHKDTPPMSRITSHTPLRSMT